MGQGIELSSIIGYNRPTVPFRVSNRGILPLKKPKDEKPAAPEAHPVKERKPFRALLKENLPIIRFVVVTLVSLVGFFLLLNVAVVQDKFVVPYTNFVAASCRAVLRLFGIQATGSGSMISSPEFSVNILNVCNGLEVTAILFATVLGFPATWKNKLLGLAVGYPAIYAINLLRIIVLFFLGYKQPKIFDTVHYYYAQAFVIIATVGVWLVWVSLYSAYGSKTRPHISS